jgi:hypothetical protein
MTQTVHEQARAEERVRFQAIMGLPEAQKLPDLAARLAFSTGCTVAEVQDALRVSLSCNNGFNAAPKKEAGALSAEALAAKINGEARFSAPVKERLAAPNQPGAVSYSDIADQLAADASASSPAPKQAGARPIAEIVAEIDAENGFSRALRR